MYIMKKDIDGWNNQKIINEYINYINWKNIQIHLIVFYIIYYDITLLQKTNFGIYIQYKELIGCAYSNP